MPGQGKSGGYCRQKLSAHFSGQALVTSSRIKTVQLLCVKAHMVSYLFGYAKYNMSVSNGMGQSYA